ncbi:type III pantothenate kinase [Asticcacaulis sp. AND118]|uniref:type III pantothenate kinase n=1 Tax=Asticcacaulis sp. AND118 TaxID=2840468 RepID=UPI001CFFEF58|nr:type III pantothenate kinase [Asticcacaulis sp. AND118]UDF04794.1 type III pantothenate kinase [Asticcacaulis sp. AND118]
MMLLAIEQGNTNTLFAVHDGENWRAQWRTATESTRTADEYAVWLYQLLQMNGLDFSQIEDCIISSVVPQSLFNLRKLAQRYFQKTPYVIGDNTHLGIQVRIDKPSEAGADRLVNTVGAWIKYGGPLIVIDSGTATTFDVVAADGALEGTAIAPGINLSVQALHQAAAKLPRIAIERPAHYIGKDTVSAMQSGIFWGYMGLIEYLTDKIQAEYGQPMTVVATGGVASLFEGATDRIHHFDPDLTLRGLLEIYQRTLLNKKKNE